MAWREKIGEEDLKTYTHNPQYPQNPQENGKKPYSADIAYIAYKIKTPQQSFDNLWLKASALADWIDNSASLIPWQDRAARVPELQELSRRLGELEMILGKKVLNKS